MTTGIHWTSETWNPTTGCSRVSPGCEHCYAEALSLRYGWSKVPWTAANAGENVILHPDRLGKPLRWKKPRLIFVDSMSDLFHDRVSITFIAQVFAVMAQTPQHTYQVLTKRPERMRLLVGSRQFVEDVDGLTAGLLPWPLPNVWLGVSVEDQRRADERVPVLCDTPAAVRFISAEPLLGPVALYTDLGEGEYRWPALDWVICGGESGPGHRPMNPDWARSLRDQCGAAGIAFFYKQGSGPRPGMNRELDGRMYEEMPVTQQQALSL